MPSREFDVAVLGGGFGGYSAAIRAAQLGKKAAVVEADKLGGTCLHLGCIPTKALLETSGLYHKVHDRGQESGIEFAAEHIINSDHATLARSLPGSVAIIGAGAVGVEFATFYRQMGAEVTLLEALDRLVPLEDEEVSGVLLHAFKRTGIDCRVGVRVRGARVEADGVTVELEDGSVQAEKLLVAVGRGPRSRDLGLERAGVEVDRRGFVKVDEWMRTSAPGVWAIGDLVGGYQLAHPAVHEGIIGAEDIAGRRVVGVDVEV